MDFTQDNLDLLIAGLVPGWVAHITRYVRNIPFALHLTFLVLLPNEGLHLLECLRVLALVMTAQENFPLLIVKPLIARSPLLSCVFLHHGISLQLIDQSVHGLSLSLLLGE